MVRRSRCRQRGQGLRFPSKHRPHPAGMNQTGRSLHSSPARTGFTWRRSLDGSGCRTIPKCGRTSARPVLVSEPVHLVENKLRIKVGIRALPSPCAQPKRGLQKTARSRLDSSAALTPGTTAENRKFSCTTMRAPTGICLLRTIARGFNQGTGRTGFLTNIQLYPTAAPCGWCPHGATGGRDDIQAGQAGLVQHGLQVIEGGNQSPAPFRYRGLHDPPDRPGQCAPSCHSGTG